MTDDDDKFKPLDNHDIQAHYVCGKTASVVHGYVHRGYFPKQNYTLPAGNNGKSVWFKGTADAWRSKYVALIAAANPEMTRITETKSPMTARKMINVIRHELLEQATKHATKVGEELMAELTAEHRDDAQTAA